jgi:hypothetical protein
MTVSRSPGCAGVEAAPGRGRFPRGHQTGRTRLSCIACPDGLWCPHATTRPHCPRRPDLPCHESRGRPHADAEVGFPVQRDGHLLDGCRHVERNALSAGLVKRAEDWRYSILWVRQHGTPEQQAILSAWPVEPAAHWPARVNAPLTDKEQDRWNLTLDRCRPFGDDAWVGQTARRLGLEHTLRRPGRPTRKKDKVRR